MMNMEVENTDDQLVTIHFDNDVNDTFNKLFLTEHSAYFEAMFNGNFLESQSEKIHIQEISYKGFVSVINSLKHKKVIYSDLNDLLTILEVSQFLQFPFIVAESIKIIRAKYLFSMYAVNVFSTVSKLGIKNLLEKSQAYVLYHFKNILDQNKAGFLQLRKVDLQTLLSNNSLNVVNEQYVFDLIVNWCLVNNNYNMEYEMIVSCVRFKSMNEEQLKYCISKTNNLNLQNIMIPYMDCTREPVQDPMTMGLFIRPIRNIPFGLCAVKNELDGYAFVYRWDWASMQFTKFIRLDPLPLDATGYHVIVKDIEVYVMAGEIAYGRGSWNKEGWKYNLLTEQWKRLKDFTTSSRRHGVGHFVGDFLYLMGGLTKHRLPNRNIELFQIDRINDTLVQIHMTSCQYFQKRVDRQFYVCLEYKGHLAIITKDNEPSWFELSPIGNDQNVYKWRRRIINLSEVVICATCYNDTVYMLTYDKRCTINLYSYCPMYELIKKLKSFNISYDGATTMCAFNVDKAMVFKNDTLEYYSVDNNFFIEYKIQLDSFHSNYLFSVPIYLEKTL
ncbi:uncharacterized protein LOC100574822 [Acyrthosiphon pisum]|uniref:BTB domain-containing protein n=1 Tax=Acyrthosiphon pisum TaxID=7029 RepID=A0A8R2A6Z8_ACYPI|nr:uncharacterized protein LOC100574822 [Acyrthosiphon pisum]XP_003245536.1 uncharacterized protein LOC100574822 [Acyrthosiphon pisum]XP_008184563.1 uncharacterized protein LOC100574822 [Acyrthosiphon pisum]|eukprot:XP_003245535.1 PREDICTED: uncharacterized protein LOC100574822 [Acyrthosiphon pisum]